MRVSDSLFWSYMLTRSVTFYFLFLLLCFGLPRQLLWNNSHDEISHPAETCSLQWLRPKISSHVLRWTPFDCKFTFRYSVSYKKIPCVDMFGSFRTGDIAILCQRKSTHIVLIDDIGVNFIALGFKELTRPEDITDFIVQTDDLTFA